MDILHGWPIDHPYHRKLHLCVYQKMGRDVVVNMGVWDGVKPVHDLNGIE